MTEGEANGVSMCGYGCNVIGGPWISTNPDCPECNESEFGPVTITEEDKYWITDGKVQAPSWCPGCEELRETLQECLDYFEWSAIHGEYCKDPNLLEKLKGIKK